ncbi:unnamed protein product [Symbiodinium sp. KB8]|nr:unnamed protein product [Symbiodinium sp. KB8]
MEACGESAGVRQLRAAAADLVFGCGMSLELPFETCCLAALILQRFACTCPFDAFDPDISECCAGARRKATDEPRSDLDVAGQAIREAELRMLRDCGFLLPEGPEVPSTLVPLLLQALGADGELAARCSLEEGAAGAGAWEWPEGTLPEEARAQRRQAELADEAELKEEAAFEQSLNSEATDAAGAGAGNAMAPAPAAAARSAAAPPGSLNAKRWG